jgi:hypothetical protein
MAPGRHALHGLTFRKGVKLQPGSTSVRTQNASLRSIG